MRTKPKRKRPSKYTGKIKENKKTRRVAAHGPRPASGKKSIGLTAEVGLLFSAAAKLFSAASPVAQTVAPCPLKKNQACGHSDLIVSSGNRTAGSLPDWAPHYSSGRVLQVLAKETINCSIQQQSPCHHHAKAIKVTGPDGRLLPPEFDVGASDFSKILSSPLVLVWPLPAWCEMYTVTAGSCKGGDETVLVQAFPNIHFEFEAGWDFGNNEYELHKPGRWPNTELSAGNTAGAYMQVNLQVDNVDVTASLSCVEDLKKRYRRINEVTSSILRAAEWFTSRLSDVGAASITVQRPKLSFGYKHGWVEDDTTPACGFTVEGSVSGDPLFGISGEADVSNYLFDLCPPLLAAKKGLEKIHAAELKLILSAGANLSGSITATKSLTSRQGNFEGTVGGECELSLQGKADVEGCFCFIHCSAGVSASATAKLTAALEGEWQPRSSKPEVTATISFDGLTIRFVVWGGVGHIDEPAEDEGQGYKFFEDITLYKGKFHPFGEDEAGG